MAVADACWRRINIESLEGKTLAVDVSIWMVQFIKAMRDDEGNMLPHAHLIGTLRRIAKLLFHHIRPVFFDGGVPALKRLTIERRRQRRAMHQETDYKTQAKRILVAQLRQQQLELQAAAKQEKQQKKKACKRAREIRLGMWMALIPGHRLEMLGSSGAVAQSESGHAAEKASNDGDEDDDGSDWGRWRYCCDLKRRDKRPSRREQIAAACRIRAP